jgi:Fic family protein
LHPLIEKAAVAIAELNMIARFIPNKDLFLYMYVRKEALLSSQIEGTQSSLSDLMLFESQQIPQTSVDDVEEVSNYVCALNYGIQRLSEGFPLSLRLIREIHAILLRGGRGSQKQPGEFRRSQNWIGGTRPGNALFVPPPPEDLMDILGNFELFLHDKTSHPLIKAGLAHVQFESIHPFLDGNGRMGRLLMVLILYNEGLLRETVLYLSLYFKQNQTAYYSLLQETRLEGRWETWLEFFLNGAYEMTRHAIDKISAIQKLFEECDKKIQKLGRLRFSAIPVFEFLQKNLQTDVSTLARALNISPPTARKVLNLFVKAKIIAEISGLKRDKVYRFDRLLSLLEE